MASRVDHVADVENGGLELYRLRQLYDFPDFVKHSEDIKLHLTKPDDPQPALCADEQNKQFWCHTKQSCWLSHLFYQEKKAEFDPKVRSTIEARLKKFANYFGIQAECDAIVSKQKAMQKEASADIPDADYAYVWVGSNGTKERHFPLRNAMEVKAAAEYVRTYTGMPFEVRHKMATKILEKAAQYSASISEHHEFLERQAGKGFGDKARIVEQITKRAYAVPRTLGEVRDADNNITVPGLRDCFLKMANEVNSMPAHGMQPSVLIKLAETLDQCDRANKLTEHYQTGVLARPEDVIFETTLTKVASEEAKRVPTTTGNVYEKEAFKRINIGDVEALFGSEFADMVKTPFGEIDVEKMAEQVATLPRPDAQLLDGMLSDNGIVPIMRKTAAAKIRPAAAMERLANAYVNNS